MLQELFILLPYRPNLVFPQTWRKRECNHKSSLSRRRWEQTSQQEFLTYSTQWEKVCKRLLISASQVTVATNKGYRWRADPSGCKGDHVSVHSGSSWNLECYPRHHQLFMQSAVLLVTHSPSSSPSFWAALKLNQVQQGFPPSSNNLILFFLQTPNKVLNDQDEIWKKQKASGQTKQSQSSSWLSQLLSEVQLSWQRPESITSKLNSEVADSVKV